MHLTKSINRKDKTKTYYKFVITIPKKILDDLGWNEKTELAITKKNHEITIKKI